MSSSLLLSIPSALPRRMFVAFTAVLVAAILPLPGSAVPGDELWDTHWNLPGASDEVDAVIEYDGKLVIAGEFEFVGDVAANRIAIYDGVSWAPLGIGFDNQVVALAIYNGDLYAGGYFNLSDGTPMGGLARWTGTQWVSVDGGTDSGVDDMVVHNGELVVAGYFTEVGGGTPAGGVAGWNGTSWSTFNGGVVDGGALAVESYGGDLYITGEFSEVGFAFVSNIARWNGVSWTGSFGGLTDEFNDPFNAGGEFLHVYDGELIVTGYFQKAGGQTLENFATYDGVSWGTLGGDPSYFADGAYEIGDYAGDLLVAGEFVAAHTWNGSFWSANIYYGAAFAFGTWGSDLVMGGLFSAINGVQAQNVIRYNGSTWSALASGDGAATGVSAFTEWNGQMVAGGTKTSFGTVSGSLVAAWDGAQWNPLGTGITGGFVNGVFDLAVYQGDLIAVGNFTEAGGVPAMRVARYTGSAWTALGSGSPGSTVHCAYVFGDSLYAGIYDSGYHVARWDSTSGSWIPVGGNANNILWCLGEYNGQLVLGGSFITIDGSSITGLATWDGASWNEIGGSALNGSVYCMVAFGGKLYIGGSFTSVGGSPANRVAVWDGVSWSEVGGGVSNRVFAMKEMDGDLFIAGEFLQGGGVTPLSYVARWDGVSWDAMGSGINEEGEALGCYDGKLFVGGDFTQAGGTAAVGISSWSMNAIGVEVPVPRPGIGVLSAYPNPFRSRTTIRYEADGAGEVEIAVHDVRGRLVSSRVLTGVIAGPQSYTWNGRDLRGRRVAAGTYFVSVRTGGATATGRVTVLR